MKEQDYIYTVYQERSFSKAAKKLFVSQPALSMAVKKAEDALGITIFDRACTPLNLTEDGKVYIKALEEMRSVEKIMRDQLSDMAELRAGHVTVSGENFVSSFILPEVLMRFSRKYAGIDVALVESNSPDLRQLLLSEAIDLLVAHDFDAQSYEAKELFEETVLLAVPEGFSSNRDLQAFSMSAEEVMQGAYRLKEPVDLSLFAGEEFLILKPGNDMYRRASLLCAEAGFSPKIRIRLDQLITAYNLCGAGMGVCFVTDQLVAKAAVKGCVYYCLKGESAHRRMFIGYKKNRYITRAAQAFIDTAIEVYASKQNAG